MELLRSNFNNSMNHENCISKPVVEAHLDEILEYRDSIGRSLSISIILQSVIPIEKELWNGSVTTFRFTDGTSAWMYSDRFRDCLKNNIND